MTTDLYTEMAKTELGLKLIALRHLLNKNHLTNEQYKNLVLKLIGLIE